MLYLVLFAIVASMRNSEDMKQRASDMNAIKEAAS